MTERWSSLGNTAMPSPSAHPSAEAPLLSNNPTLLSSMSMVNAPRNITEVWTHVTN